MDLKNNIWEWEKVDTSWEKELTSTEIETIEKINILLSKNSPANSTKKAIESSLTESVEYIFIQLLREYPDLLSDPKVFKNILEKMYSDTSEKSIKKIISKTSEIKLEAKKNKIEDEIWQIIEQLSVSNKEDTFLDKIQNLLSKPKELEPSENDEKLEKLKKELEKIELEIQTTSNIRRTTRIIEELEKYEESEDKEYKVGNKKFFLEQFKRILSDEEENLNKIEEIINSQNYDLNIPTVDIGLVNDIYFKVDGMDYSWEKIMDYLNIEDF